MVEGGNPLNDHVRRNDAMGDFLAPKRERHLRNQLLPVRHGNVGTVTIRCQAGHTDGFAAPARHDAYNIHVAFFMRIPYILQYVKLIIT
jgi:hypothetical protein